MDNWVIYVTANGDLARQALNAIAILMGTTTGDTFLTATKISILFGIIGTAFSYIRGRDITVFAKWFIAYFIVSSIMLQPISGNLRIIDCSNPGRADLTVSGLPYGLVVPASIITGFSHGLTTAFEKAFSMPDDLQYSKNGMLFGSKLFKQTTEFNITSPVLKDEINQYIKSCIIPDINVLGKYTLQNLTESQNITSVIFDPKNTSASRGIYMRDRTTTKDALGVTGTSISSEPLFNTCQEAAPKLSKYINSEAQGPIRKLALRLFPFLKQEDPASRLFNGIAAAYQKFNYASTSSDALNIATQNILINALRDGFKAYASEANDTAGLLNQSTSLAMDRMRMNLATSKNMAVYGIPVIHTTLLLLFLRIFPIIVILSFQPSIFVKVIKNYIYFLIWLETWPLLFACVNLIMTYYVSSSSGLIAGSGVTMQNIDMLALEHSDISNMAGYLIMLIPFISGGLIYGMVQVFTSAANHIGGVFQSSAAAASSEAATGNIHLGNASWGNVNANKLDTNYSTRGGMSTKQLQSGVTETIAADGTPIVDSTAATSRLSTNIKFDEMLSDSLTKQHREAVTAGEQKQQSIDTATSSALNHLGQFSNSTEHRKNASDDVALKEALSYAQDYNNMASVSEHLSKKTGMSQQDSLRKLTEAFAGIPLAKLAGTGASGRISSEVMASHLKAHDINLNAEDVEKFGESYNRLKAFDATKNAGQMDANSLQHLSNASADLRKAESYSEQKSKYLAQSESAEKALAYTKQHSSHINSDIGQPFVEYLRQRIGAEESNKLAAGRTVNDHMKLRSYAQDFVNSIDFTAQFGNVPAAADVRNKYKPLDNPTPYLEEKFNINQEGMQNRAYQEGVLSDDKLNKKYRNVVDQATAGRNYIDRTIDTKKDEVPSEYGKLAKEVTEKLEQGKHEAQQSVTQSLTQQVKDSPQWGLSLIKDTIIDGVPDVTVSAVKGTINLIDKYGKVIEADSKKE
jgi:conjugal transfer mating pair stabilization protein TraG